MTVSFNPFCWLLVAFPKGSRSHFFPPLDQPRSQALPARERKNDLYGLETESWAGPGNEAKWYVIVGISLTCQLTVVAASAPTFVPLCIYTETELPLLVAILPFA